MAAGTSISLHLQTIKPVEVKARGSEVFESGIVSLGFSQGTDSVVFFTSRDQAVTMLMDALVAIRRLEENPED